MTEVKVTDQCVEMRVVVPRHTIPTEQSILQYRSLRICVDASGALCPNGYTEWINVPTTSSNAEFSSAMDQRRGRKS